MTDDALSSASSDVKTVSDTVIACAQPWIFYINLFNLESLGNADVMRSNSVRSNDGEEAAGDQVS